MKSRLAQTASDYQAWSSQARQKIAGNALPLIVPGSTIFTFTLSETVLGVLREVHRRGAQFRVLVTESRPNNDGRVTARSLCDEGIEVGLGVDASVGELLAQADLMLVGAEAVLRDGSAICKVGTYPAALAARRSNVPVFVLVDTMKLHVGSLFGEALRLDPIQPTSLPGATADEELAVSGHLFDRTPGGVDHCPDHREGNRPSLAGRHVDAGDAVQPDCRRQAAPARTEPRARRLSMTNHPDVVAMVERVRKDEIGGAADTAKEVIDALGEHGARQSGEGCGGAGGGG